MKRRIPTPPPTPTPTPTQVNALDGCAASLPCHVPGEAPVGFSVAGMRGTDAHVLGVAQAIEAVLNKE